MSGSNPQPGGNDGRLIISRIEDAVVIVVVGLGNMFLAPTLQSFVESELKAGFRNFVIDLKECRGMDSTFMGTFIGLSNEVKKRFGWFCLVNISEENRCLLKMLGVIHMVAIHDGDFPLTEGPTTTLYPTNDLYFRQKQIHSAHRLLVEADSGNYERFGAFVRALEEEMNDLPTIVPPKEPEDNGSGKSRER